MSGQLIAFLIGSALLAVLALLFGPLAPRVPATTDADATLPAVELGGYRFHAEAHGPADAPVVIVLHGGPGADYRYLLGLAALADRYRVVFFDQRGTGLSPRVPAESITVDGYVADLDLFVDHFGGGRPVILLGHSWGGQLASAYAGKHPDKVSHLILAEPGFLTWGTSDAFRAGGGPSPMAMAGIALAWLNQWRVRGDGFAHADYFTGQLLLAFQGPDRFCNGKAPALTAWRAGSPAFAATVGRMIADKDFAESLSFVDGIEGFKGRTLFLSGACSTLIGADQQARHALFFHGAEQAVIAGAGHFMFNDAPEAAMARVRAFLGR